jgi:D-sedoheptulose 7-phosphate isomerase
LVKNAIRVHEGAVRELAGQASLLAEIAECLTRCVRSGRRIYVLGNGGSAADAQHIAAEIMGKFRRDRRGFPATALTTDTSLLTAVSNDYGFETIFERQIEALVGDGDVVWVLSTSGRSPNVLRAVRAAKRQGAQVVGFTGGTGGELVKLCDRCLIAAARTSERIQEIHQLAYHIVCHQLEEALCE